MIFALETLPRWTETLGWTLLNSVWQGAITTTIVIFLLRILPPKFSKIRYAIACAGLALLLISSVTTFVLLETRAQAESNQVSYFFSGTSVNSGTRATTVESEWYSMTLTSVKETIDANMPLILLAWSLGALLCSLRLAGGWWFISKLKSNAIKLNGQWNDELQRLAKKLGIDKVVQLAESTRITTPMVVGFFKPLVLVPAGMLSGLSTAEIETIFLHELAHIRRHDYLINIAQAFIETLFFFNPFVWIISSMVRREREYCCDDDVIRVHGSSLTYAKALAQLEEWRLTNPTFALALAANKNQLLNRIKRIMEKTGQKYSVKDRFMPAVLLIVGLVCASWLTVQKKNQNVADLDDNTFAQDTTPKKLKSSRTTIIRIDENGETHQQIFEEGDSDDTAFEWAPPAWPVDVEVPAFPMVPPVVEIAAFPMAPSVVEIAAFPSFPAFPSVHALPAPPAGVWRISPSYHDTIPGAWMRHGQKWEDFSKEFEKKFSEEFSDFYKKHEADFDKMMKEMELKFKQEFENGNSHGQLMEAQRLQELAQLDAMASEEHFRISADVAAEAEALASLSELHAPMIADMAALSADLVHLDGNMKVLHEQVEVFEGEINEMLIKDGYLKKGEKVKDMRWGDDEIEVNGKRIKDSDAKKYHEKHDKLFKKSFHVPKVE
jgi:bla regulator protein blaR1